jgi:hypothetical protein
MKSSLYILGIFVFIVLAGFGLYAQGKASYHCGFAKSIFYGKNVTWAYYMGYCD